MDGLISEATEELKAREKEATGGRTPISLTAACELFFRYVTRPNDDAPVRLTSAAAAEGRVKDCR